MLYMLCVAAWVSFPINGLGEVERNKLSLCMWVYDYDVICNQSSDYWKPLPGFAKDVSPVLAHNLLLWQLCNIAAAAGCPRKLTDGLL